MSSAHFHLPSNLFFWLLALSKDKHIQNLNEDKKRAEKMLSSEGNFHRKK